MAALPALAGTYLAVSVAGVALVLRHGGDFGPKFVPNILLLGLYGVIGYYLLRTQLANRPSMGGWSVSGLSLSVIFPTCALMHMVWAAYAVAGRYQQDGHGLVIDWLSVPAGIYFLVVVRSLYRDSLRDWNDGPDEVIPDAPKAQPVGGAR